MQGGKKELKKELKIEESLSRLEKIVGQLESEEVTLDDSLKLFEEGMKLYQLCEKKIGEADLRITELKKDLKAVDLDEDEEGF